MLQAATGKGHLRKVQSCSCQLKQVSVCWRTGSQSNCCYEQLQQGRAAALRRTSAARLPGGPPACALGLGLAFKGNPLHTACLALGCAGRHNKHVLLHGTRRLVFLVPMQAQQARAQLVVNTTIVFFGFGPSNVFNYGGNQTYFATIQVRAFMMNTPRSTHVAGSQKVVCAVQTFRVRVFTKPMCSRPQVMTCICVPHQVPPTNPLPLGSIQFVNASGLVLATAPLSIGTASGNNLVRRNHTLIVAPQDSTHTCCNAPLRCPSHHVYI